MKIYDAIVVGAGPAGAAAAYFLARAGRSVLLLEKRAFPRPKSCAGGLPRKAAQIFDFDLSPCFEVAVKGAVFSWLSSERRYQEGDRVLGWVTRREVFDEFLVRRAVAVPRRVVERAHERRAGARHRRVARARVHERRPHGLHRLPCREQ